MDEGNKKALIFGAVFVGFLWWLMKPAKAEEAPALPTGTGTGDTGTGSSGGDTGTGSGSSGGSGGGGSSTTTTTDTPPPTNSGGDSTTPAPVVRETAPPPTGGTSKRGGAGTTETQTRERVPAKFNEPNAAEIVQLRREMNRLGRELERQFSLRLAATAATLPQILELMRINATNLLMIGRRLRELSACDRVCEDLMARWENYLGSKKSVAEKIRDDLNQRKFAEDMKVAEIRATGNTTLRPSRSSVANQAAAAKLAPQIQVQPTRGIRQVLPTYQGPAVTPRRPPGR
jgi:hypothetical protein